MTQAISEPDHASDKFNMHVQDCCSPMCNLLSENVIVCFAPRVAITRQYSPALSIYDSVRYQIFTYRVQALPEVYHIVMVFAPYSAVLLNTCPHLKHASVYQLWTPNATFLNRSITPHCIRSLTSPCSTGTPLFFFTTDP